MDSRHTGYNSQNGNETMRIMIIKSKIISLLLASVLFIFSGCASTSKEHPYDSSFANAKEFAEYWCGPCEEIDSYTVTAGDAEVLIHKFTDTEFGFTYTVEERYHEYSNKSKPVASYYCRDFDYYYLKEFLNRTDLSPVTDKYDITIEQDELIETKNKDIYNIYFNGISMWTDRSLTDAEGSEVMEFVYNALDSFDTRDHFTKDPNCTSVSYALYCAPREEEAAVGTPHHMFSGRYGYRQ